MKSSHKKSQFLQRLFPSFHRNPGQSMLEQMALLMLVASGIIVMGPYVLKGWNAALKTVDDSVKDSHLDPLYDGSITQICAQFGPRNGGWSGWHPENCLDACDAECGPGNCIQTRTCTAPTPRCGGAYCPGGPGNNVRSFPCNKGCCPQDGYWIGYDSVNNKWLDDPVSLADPTLWTPWSACLEDCRRFKTKVQDVHCVYPDPTCPGKPCPAPPFVWDDTCGNVDGTWTQKIEPCQNCKQIITWECSSKCNGLDCKCDDIPAAMRPASCPAGTLTRDTQQISVPCNNGSSCFAEFVCKDDDHYYKNYSCQAGVCQPDISSLNACPVGNPRIEECTEFSGTKCVGGNVAEADVCVPENAGPVPNVPPIDCEIVDLNQTIIPVHCSDPDGNGFRTAWYDRKYCIDGGCSGFDPADKVDCTTLGSNGDGISIDCLNANGQEDGLDGCDEAGNNDGCLIKEPNQCDPLDLASGWNDLGAFCKEGDYKDTTNFRCNYDHHCADIPNNKTHWYDGYSCQPYSSDPTLYGCTGNYGSMYACAPLNLPAIKTEIVNGGGTAFEDVCVDIWTPSECDDQACATGDCCTDYQISFHDDTTICSGPMCIDDNTISDDTGCNSANGACDSPVGSNACLDVLKNEIQENLCECKGAQVKCQENPGDDTCVFRNDTTNCWLSEGEVCTGVDESGNDCGPDKYSDSCCPAGQIWVN